jgi:hypothetical protein
MIPRTVLRSQNGRLLKAAVADGAVALNNGTNGNLFRLFHSHTPVLSGRLPWMAGSNHVGSLLHLYGREDTGTTSKYALSVVKLLPDVSYEQQQQKSQRNFHYRVISTSSHPTTSNTSHKDDNNHKSKPAEKATFRSMVRQYGPLFITTYLTVYVSTVFGFYLGIASGTLDPAYLLSFITSSAENADPDAAVNSVEVIKEMLNKYSWTQPAVPFVEKHPWAANLGVAWVVTKPTEPIRFGLTVGLTPLLARALGHNNVKTAEKATEEGKQHDEKSS